MYRKQLAMPLALSFLAIFVNIPAFFEVTTITCYRTLTKRLVYVLKISGMRLSPVYTLWYKVVFRMLITTCGPNICILLLTVRTVMLLRGSTKTRRSLFQMSDSLIDRYSSKATMLTMISIMLVVKFLAFRSLSFMLDIWELLFGFGTNIRVFVYLVDLSNIMILLNSSTNCFIIFWCSKWLQEKIVQRNTLKREKLICGEGNWFASSDRMNLLHKSWRQLVSHTQDQVGQRVLYAMLTNNPPVFSMFRQICKSSQTGTPVQCNRNKRVIRLTSSARMISTPSIEWDPLGKLHPESISISATVNELIDDKYRHSPKPVQIVVPIMKQDDSEVFHNLSDSLNDLPSTSNDSGTVGFMLDAERYKRSDSRRPSSPSSTKSSSSTKKMKKSHSAVPMEPKVHHYSCPMTDEERGEKPVEILMNRQFNKISEQITTFLDTTISDMRKGKSEADVAQSIRKLGDLHYEKGILIPPTAWRDFKTSIIKALEECNYSNEHERSLVMETWNSFIAMFIREMKLSMLGASNNAVQPNNIHHKFSTVSQCNPGRRQ
ncbi:unnamed protein product [Bursaphelenchus okinawaensis]|uniref:Uncharacterized protein n=1 Tax=Bursaphelenchus okinawaensis TaxID=465554 RepID=A0A811LDJ0_9BILA|nr:unnamed protein product [Bursaphelenchus okinawaensis]CAG9121929.1 unnamed protein product [Bursaphelenchus okinawaensis]